MRRLFALLIASVMLLAACSSGGATPGAASPAPAGSPAAPAGSPAASPAGSPAAAASHAKRDLARRSVAARAAKTPSAYSAGWIASSGLGESA